MQDHRLPEPLDAYDHFLSRVHDDDDSYADHDNLSPMAEYMLALGYPLEQDELQDDFKEVD